MPAWLTHALASAIEGGFRAISLRIPGTAGMIDKYAEDVAVDGQRIQRELGFKPQYDLRAGWAETVHAMRRMGRLPG